MWNVQDDSPGDRDDAADLPIALGIAIRSARKAVGITLQELAGRTGLSPSFLSQAENGHTVPSVLNLHAIARALETSAHDLLSRAEEDASLVRATDGPLLDLSPGATLHRCTRRGASMGPTVVTADPGVSASSATHHAGEEFVFVIEGEVDLEVGATTYRLAEGDTLYYNATVRHRWHNRSAARTRFLITSSPPF